MKSINTCLSELRMNILQTIYPVGTIYTSFNNTNPKTIFGFGEWQQIINQFLYCSNSSGQTGGEITHLLTPEEMPVHNHTFTGNNQTGSFLVRQTETGGAATVYNFSGVFGGGSQSSGTSWGHSLGLTGDSGQTDYVNFSMTPTGTISNSGGLNGTTQPHNNMPPYITCYAWRRTA